MKGISTPIYRYIYAASEKRILIRARDRTLERRCLNRRRFLKYAGGTAAVVGASALGLDYFLTPRPSALNQTSALTATSSQFKLPPIAQFDYVPKYIEPTDQQLVQFTNLSTDLYGDPLTYQWFVDNQPVSTEKDYSAKLPVGSHTVELRTSDPTITACPCYSIIESTITVESDQIYPTRQLNVTNKGMRYSAGAWAPYAATPTPTSDEMEEQLGTIRNELGCNAILVNAGAGYEENLIECGRIAIEKGFDRIYIQPEFMDSTIDETIQKVHEFIESIKPLRAISDSVVFVVGHEFGLETYGIIPGNTWYDRLQYQIEHNDWLEKVRSALPNMLDSIITDCKQNYGYPITYSAAIWEDDLVPWHDPSIESVCVDAYIMDSVGWTADWISEHLSSFKEFGKPVNSAEWGCMTFTGAGAVSGTSPLYVGQNPYDENEQANYIQQYFQMLNGADIGGCFYTIYTDPPTYPKGFGLLNGLDRKKGFYMYKSYQRT